jgi:hypothetical protein
VGKYYVACPGNTVTGGPELLHQFVDALNHQGAEAYILYYPFNETFETPEEYHIYNVKQGDFRDVRSNNLFLTETNTKMAARFPDANINIWWLSVDFFLGTQRESVYVDMLRYMWSLAFSRVPISRLRNCSHWTQSNYAKEFLKKHKIDSRMLSDYLNINHDAMSVKSPSEKKDIILFNPKKGQKRTAKLIDAYPDLTFVPIQNMTAKEVSHILSLAKIYIDFGHHPGKDRLPREAVLAGCCVITGKYGSARNDHDVPIKTIYKLDDLGMDYIKSFGALSSDIFENYEFHLRSFDNMRKNISLEKSNFDHEVSQILNVNLEGITPNE